MTDRHSGLKIASLFALLLLALFSLFQSHDAPAANGKDTVSWTLPTTRLDQSPLAPTDIATVVVYTAPTLAGLATSTDTLNLPGTATSADFTRTGFGTQCYAVAVIDTGGLSSAQSAGVCNTVAALPSPPDNVKVTHQ